MTKEIDEKIEEIPPSDWIQDMKVYAPILYEMFGFELPGEPKKHWWEFWK